MNKADPPTLESLVGTCLSQASTTISTPGRKLKLYARPIPRYFPDKRRSREQLPPALYALFKTLAGGEGRWPLFLHGPAGVGKTSGALWLCDYALGLYFTAQELAESFIREMKLDNGDTAGYWKYLANSNLVVVDEIGAQAKVSDHHQSCIKGLLDRRENRPMIVLSNLPVSAIATIYGDTVASRLAGGTAFFLDGPDRRLERGT